MFSSCVRYVPETINATHAGFADFADVFLKFQVILHKKGAPTDKPIADLDYPLLETDKEWVIHGFSHANYLAELGDAAQSE